MTVFSLWEDAKRGVFDISRFLQARQKRLSFTMMMLCDTLNLKLTPQLLE
jgi:hypothetical protein